MLLLNFAELLHDDFTNLGIARQNFLQFGNPLAKFFEFIFNFLALETGQALQLHLEDGLGLNLAEFELRHQAFTGFGCSFRGADQLDDRIDVIEGFL